MLLACKSNVMQIVGAIDVVVHNTIGIRCLVKMQLADFVRHKMPSTWYVDEKQMHGQA